MAKITVPIKIDGFECVEDMVQAVLNYSYKGRTLKEWADGIAEPKTNADRIRAMTDEELANTMHDMTLISTEIGLSTEWWEQWLKSPVEPVEVDNG